MKLLLYVTRKCLWKGYTVCGKCHDFVVTTIGACSEKYECLVQNALDNLPNALVWCQCYNVLKQRLDL